LGPLALGLYETKISQLKSHLDKNLICHLCGRKHDSEKQLATHNASTSRCEGGQADKVAG
jgi:hypothetical protein